MTPFSVWAPTARRVELLIGDAMQDPDEWTSLIPGHEGWVRLREICDVVIRHLEAEPVTEVA